MRESLDGPGFDARVMAEEGGRILVVSDHNSLTDNYINDLDNLTLAQNIVEWAAGEGWNSR